MDKEHLLQKKADLEQRFNDLMDETKRLQGEYRLVSELLDKYEEPGEEIPVQINDTKRKVKQNAKD